MVEREGKVNVCGIAPNPCRSKLLLSANAESPRVAARLEEKHLPSFSRDLEEALHRAVSLARNNGHKFATLEHLLAGLLADPSAKSVLDACEVDRAILQDDLDTYIGDLAKYFSEQDLFLQDGEDPKPTAGFQRVIQRAVIHVQSSGRDVVKGENVLVSIFSERESHAAFFLQKQHMSRYDAVLFIAHGTTKQKAREEDAAKERKKQGGEVVGQSSAGGLGFRPPKLPRSTQNPVVAKREIYVSYAWGDRHTSAGRARGRIVDQLCEAARSKGIHVIRDRDSLGVGASISEFMGRLGEADRVFVILSKKYLESTNCMFELSEIWRNSNQNRRKFLETVRIFALPDANIWKAADWIDWAVYWKRAHDELDAKAREHGVSILGSSGYNQLRYMQTFYTQVADILGTLSDIVVPKSLKDLEKYGFE